MQVLSFQQRTTALQVAKKYGEEIGDCIDKSADGRVPDSNERAILLEGGYVQGWTNTGLDYWNLGNEFEAGDNEVSQMWDRVLAALGLEDDESLNDLKDRCIVASNQASMETHFANLDRHEARMQRTG